MKKENRAIVRGTIIENPKFFSVTKSDEYYMVKVNVLRKSGTADIIPVVIPRKNIDPNADYINMRINLDGQLQTVRRDGHLIMYVFAISADIYYNYDENEEDLNDILFTGVMKGTVIRKTGQKQIPIADVHFLSTKFFFPCIAWNKDAKKIKKSKRNTEMKVIGRFQSRDYKKVIEGEVKDKTASEISIQKLEIL